MIGMYKKLHGLIERERERGRFFMRVGICFFLATDKWSYVNLVYIEYTLFFTYLTEPFC